MTVDQRQIDQLTRIWSPPSGIRGWFAAVNNQPLGKRYMLTALIFFVLGGLLALLIRIQLTVSENEFLGPEAYNAIFTMHGTTMMYLFAVPFLEGLALYMVPLMIGSRDVAFPRLTSFGYWCYVFGGLTIYASFFFGAVPDAGWFAYTPLSGPQYSGIGLDFWVLGLGLVEVAGLTAAVEIVVSILKFRTPGMSLTRMPLFVWSILVAGVMILFGFTPLLTATMLLELDRAMGTHFFNPALGGSTLLWQHLFWFFGHPEVYIMFLPATGIVSTVIPTFARRPIVGYVLIVVAILITGFVSFGLWVHHMYATGIPALALTFFAAASLMIALASGTQVFAWIATLWGSSPRFTTPLLYVLGFLFVFVLGGMTGVMVAVVPFDWQVHDTFFVVAHFHYVLIGGVVFPIFAGLHYWFPKITGRMPSRALGLWAFWLNFIGFNVAFFPMHIMGFLGMPRRVYTYPSSLEIDWYNIISTGGSFVLGLGFLLEAVNFLLSMARGRRAGANPWNGSTLEWSIPSPPPAYSFLTPPVVRGRDPLWAPGGADPDDAVLQRSVKGLHGQPVSFRATLVTDLLDAQPQAVQRLPGPTLIPFATATLLLIASIGVLSQAYLLSLVAAAGVFLTLIQWLWPSPRVIRQILESDVGRDAELPMFVTGSRSTAWWGVVCLIAILATALGALAYAYFYLWLFSPRWPQDDLLMPRILVPGLTYATLLVAAMVMGWAWRARGRNATGEVIIALGAAVALSVGFLAAIVYQTVTLPFAPTINAYASIFHVLTWAAIGFAFTSVCIAAATLIRIRRTPPGAEALTTLQLQIATMLGWFTAVAAAVVYATLHLSPHVLGGGS